MYKQKYRKQWETDQNLKLWIRPFIGNETKARCFFCKCEVSARNRISLNSVNSLLHIKYGLKRENCCCDNYQIPDNVNLNINSTSVYKKSEFEIKTLLWAEEEGEFSDFDSVIC